MPCVALIRNLNKIPCKNRTPLCVIQFETPDMPAETLAETIVNAYRDTLGITGEYVNIEWSHIAQDSFLLVSYLVDDNGKVDGKPRILTHIVDLCFVPNY